MRNTITIIRKSEARVSYKKDKLRVELTLHPVAHCIRWIRCERIHHGVHWQPIRSPHGGMEVRLIIVIIISRGKPIENQSDRQWIRFESKMNGWNAAEDLIPYIHPFWMTFEEPNPMLHQLLGVIYTILLIFSSLANGCVIWIFST